MHGTSLGENAGGFPAESPGVDQFAGDAHGDFFRGYSLDGGADGCMDPGNGFFRNTAFSQLLVDCSSLFPGTNNANIGKVSPENLVLDFQIEAVTVGHDDDVIITGKLQIVRYLPVMITSSS